MNLLPMFLQGWSRLPECALCGKQRKRVHDITMIDNRGKSPERIAVPMCPSCIDYLEPERAPR